MSSLDEIKSRDSASFRDPAATVRKWGDNIVRVIESSYFNEYEHFMKYVYPELIEKGLIISHSDINSFSGNEHCILPKRIPFISYPYEWSFEMLKEAALVTLRINHVAMKHGMMLKDATAYNIQYYEGQMVLIDTTSFMFYDGNSPWPSYPQFLRHFVAPLLWIKYCNHSANRLSEIYLDGIPLPLTYHMLPLTARLFNPGIMAHIWTQSMAGLFSREPKNKKITMRAAALKALLSSLYRFVKGLKYKPVVSENDWLKYNSEADSYTLAALDHKQSIVSNLINITPWRPTLLDLGANTGDYSIIAALSGYRVISADSDHDCVYHMYDTPGILPLVVDICNPSPGIGWANTERPSFWDRVGKVDTILALALIHHLSVANNVPLDMVADLLADHCDTLIVEWVPLEDKQAQKLLNNKHIPKYNHEVFLKAFGRRFHIERTSPIVESGRVIYKMQSEEK